MVFTLVQKASVPAIENIKARQHTQTDLNLLRFYIERSESELLRYLITPEAQVRKEIYFLLDSYQAVLQRMRHSRWAQASPILRERLDEQAGDKGHLQKQITTLLDIRDNNRKLFPPMPIMLNEMLPANQKFYTAATLAMDALDDDALKIGNETALAQFREFATARHGWSQMIGAFRLYVTNRLGIFGDPVSSVRASLTNIRYLLAAS